MYVYIQYGIKFSILSFKSKSVVTTDVEKKTIKQLCEFILFLLNKLKFT